LKWLPHSPYSRTVRDALSLVLLTGCRSGEVVAALWRDIDLERGVWTIRETKNGEPHDVMLPRQAAELLRSRLGLDQVYVFPSPRGRGACGGEGVGFFPVLRAARRWGQAGSRSNRGSLDRPRPAAHCRDRAGETRLPACRAGSYPQSRRSLCSRYLRSVSLRFRSARLATEVGGPSRSADREQRGSAACGVKASYYSYACQLIMKRFQ